MSSNAAAKIDFTDQSWDSLLNRWLAGQLNDKELGHWKKRLLQDEPFREEFCDWVRSLREPAFLKLLEKSSDS
jgi:hypothetical protein